MPDVDASRALPSPSRSARVSDKPDSLDDVIAGLSRAIRLASEELPELVGYIAPALDMLTQTQLAISALGSRKQQLLQQMAVLELQLAGCDPGERAAYVMDRLDLPKSTYYEYRKLLEQEGVIPDESGLSGLTTEAGDED
jgi:hypothetical protein